MAEKTLEQVIDELASVKLALGTLIAWLNRELGAQSATELLELLNGKKP